MSIKPQFESYRYVGEICRLNGQSIVECRLPGSEISSILAVYAKAVPVECACLDGEVQYSGKLLLCIVYEDGEHKICRAERGAEFFHKAEGALVTRACFAKGAYSAENITWRREGSGLYISVIVGAELAVFGGKQIEYLSGGEGLVCQKEALTVYKTVCVSGEIEGEDEFDCDYVGDVLLHSASAIVNHVAANAGQVEIEGEMALNICVLKGDESVCSYERLIPFRMQVPADEAFGTVTTNARICVKNAHLSANADEESGKSRMVFSYGLSADCFLYIKEELSSVSDAFSTSSEICLKRAKDGGRYLTKRIRCTERVGGIASISPILEGEYSLQAAVLPKAELSCRKGENGMEAEGVVTAKVIFVGAEGARRAAELSLPVLFPIEAEGEFAEVECIVCGLNLRRKKNGETEADATLKLTVNVYEQKEWEYVSNLEEGEEYGENDCAFSVFLPEEGESLWQVAKRLRCEPESLQKSNPELEFPVKAGQRIYVYRQIE
ncbi:MAG: hypothetical protein J6B05_03795 [Clostridia bacterium]|nr:hypothetical protein [Clostridia bacterium]